jgi:hypothetical protein
VFVSRVRVDPTVENGLALWVVSDNLRKGRRSQRRADRRGADQGLHLIFRDRRPLIGQEIDDTNSVIKQMLTSYF